MKTRSKPYEEIRESYLLNFNEGKMLYHVRMNVQMPEGMSEQESESIKIREREYAQRLQKEGKWIHLWRVVGEYANYSIFDVSSHDELHEILSGLPLYPYMTISVTPLARHPSALED